MFPCHESARHYQVLTGINQEVLSSLQMIRDHQNIWWPLPRIWGHASTIYMYVLPNMPLTNKYTSMMDRFCQPQFKHLCLKPSLQEIFNLQTQNIIKLHSALIQYPNTNQATQKCITCIQRNTISPIKNKALTSTIVSTVYNCTFTLD